MKKIRVEQHRIKRTDTVWEIIDKFCFASKNLYNYANYIIRREFINNNKWIGYNQLSHDLKDDDVYKACGSQAAQNILRLLDKNWSSSFKAIKDWSKHPDKYLGRPKLPKYLKKDGRYYYPLKNIQCAIKDGMFRIGFKPFKGYSVPTKAKGRLLQCRFIPRGNCYVLEIVYEIDVPSPVEKSTNIASIDLGLTNFVTMTNNIGLQPIIIKGGVLKSINQYYNKKLAKMKSELKVVNDKHWSKNLEKLTQKRFEKLKYQMHCYSKWIVDYCVLYGIDTLVCGYNAGWKQESKMSKTTNQKFVYLPYHMFVQQLAYKCENNGIQFITTEESYTSGTSFLDGELPIKKNYDKSRRVARGLFKSNEGHLINADVNGSYQIIKKVFPNVFSEGIEGAGQHPMAV